MNGYAALAYFAASHGLYSWLPSYHIVLAIFIVIALWFVWRTVVNARRALCYFAEAARKQVLARVLHGALRINAQRSAKCYMWHTYYHLAMMVIGATGAALWVYLTLML